MSNVKERLMAFLKEERVSASEFARRMELSPTYLSSMRKSMPEEKVERLIKEFPQLNRDWLLYGEGEMYRQPHDPDLDPHLLHRHLVPLVPVYAEGGTLAMYAEGVSRKNCTKVISPVPDADIAINVRGNSMEPKIPDGARLFLRKLNDKAFIPWGSPLVLDTENGTVVKMLLPGDEEETYLIAKSYNPDFPPYKIPTETIIGIYRILATVMESGIC